MPSIPSRKPIILGSTAFLSIPLLEWSTSIPGIDRHGSTLIATEAVLASRSILIPIPLLCIARTVEFACEARVIFRATAVISLVSRAAVDIDWWWT